MNMPLVEVAIGLAVVYLMMSILCSSAMEMIAGYLDLRGEMLWKGIESMLGGQGAGGFLARLQGIAGAFRSNIVSGAPSPQAPGAGAQVQALSAQLFEHPVVDSMRSGSRAPSYLTAEQFSTVLLDTLGGAYRAGLRVQADLSSTVRALPEGPLKSNLELILRETGGDLAQTKARIQQWYDEVMARVTGWYKRQTQWILLALGFLAAALLNVDSIDLAKRLWQDPMLRSVAVKTAEAYVPKSADELKAGTPDERARKALQEFKAMEAGRMPLGWPTPWYGNKDMGTLAQVWGFVGSLLGWAITALAISLGAPYWYELLLKLLPMARSSGARPPAAAPGSATAGASVAAPTIPPAARPAAPPMPFQNALNGYEAALTQDDVREIQEELGLEGAQRTGNLDQATREAIKRAQADRKMAATGELSPALVADLLRERRTR